MKNARHVFTDCGILWNILWIPLQSSNSSDYKRIRCAVEMSKNMWVNRCVYNEVLNCECGSNHVEE